jgi:hypothetical protein
MRDLTVLAIAACAITAPAIAQRQQQQQIAPPVVFSIKSGETLPLRYFGIVNNDCVSQLGNFDSLDILDGPSEISLKYEPGPVTLTLSGGVNEGKVCKDVSGGTIIITVGDISERKTADLEIRLRYKNKYGQPLTTAYSYQLRMFPGQAASPVK